MESGSTDFSSTFTFPANLKTFIGSTQRYLGIFLLLLLLVALTLQKILWRYKSSWTKVYVYYLFQKKKKKKEK